MGVPSNFIKPEEVEVWILVNPGEIHPEQRGHGSSRESRGELCEDRKVFPRWGKSLSFEGTYLYPCQNFILVRLKGEGEVENGKIFVQ